MYPKPAFVLLGFLCCLGPFYAAAQKPLTPKSPPPTPLDSMMLHESRVTVFKQSSIGPDTSKATLRVKILEKDMPGAPIQGATVLLRRDKDKMLGRVSKYDGKCMFSAAPATYTVRVQMTGLKTLEKTGFKLEAGKVYDMEIRMEKN